MLKIENFSKNFTDSFIALDKVSFEVKPGEFLVILGPSGSGKTTLLRTINGLVKRDSGNLYYQNKIITDNCVPEFRQKFGMIFQHFNLVENLKVINNVLSGALTRANTFLSLFYIFSDELKLNALQCLDRVELLEKAYERTANLSGGQKQRVGIARAIMQQPDIILADEPIANLDPMIAYNILKLLKKICLDDNISIICNLHQVDFALQFADRIICLANGKILIDDSSENLSSEIIYQAYSEKSQGMFFKNSKIK